MIPKWPVWLWAAILLPRCLMGILTALHPQACMSPDSESYWLLAENLWNHQAFTRAAAPPWTPEMFRVPGYPLFLSMFVPLFSSPILVIALVQLVIGAATIGMFGAWLRQMADERAALAGALILAVDPLILLHTPMVLGETLVLFLQVAALFQTWRSWKQPRTSQVIAGGMLWGLTLMVKPVFLYFPLILSALWIRQRKFLFCFLLAAYALPGAWIARNGVKMNYWGLTSQAGFDLLKYPAAGIEALRSGRPVESVQVELKSAVDAQYPQGYANEAEQSRVYQQAAARIFKDHPIFLIRYCAAGVLRILTGTGISLWSVYLTGAVPPPVNWSLSIIGEHVAPLLRRNLWLLPIIFLYGAGLTVLYAGSVAGLERLRRSARQGEAFLLAAGILYILAVSSHQGYSRFRIPMMPFLAAAFAFAVKPNKRDPAP